MPAWDTWRTPTSFFITTLLLGQLLTINLLQITGTLVWGIVAVLLALESVLTLSAKPKAEGSVNRLRVGLIVTAMLGAGIMSIASSPLGMWTSLSILLIVLAEEIIARWLFYEALQERLI
jgi:DMSO reductase anchor subunit